MTATPRRDPGTQLPLLIDPNDPAPDVDVEETRALLESLVEGLKNWDGTTSQDEPIGDGEQQGIRELMDKSTPAFGELGIRVEYHAVIQRNR
ncbi:hypothetical protein [Nocardia salmonicida]|uniref:hypothetical protein n=1 Tax=Nocardia salmonicida TaxID=53431 RepID=UPI003789D69F